MDTLYSAADGSFVRHLTQENRAEFGPPPVFSFSQDFDAGTNPVLIAAIQASPNRVTLDGSGIKIDGLAYTVIADSQQETDRKALPTLKSQIETYMGLSDLADPADLAPIAAGSNAAAIVTYINGTLLPRINQLDTLVTRTNANTNATQGIFRILRYIGIKLGILS